MSPSLPRRAWLRALLASTLVSACGGSERSSLIVLAAASLTDAFAELEHDYEARHPEIDVVVSTAGSQALRVQIEQGAPADLFASANATHMDAVVEAGLVRDPWVFARGELVIAVPRGNPAGVHGLGDLPRASRVVLGTPEVPVGSYARALLDRAQAHYGADFRARVEARVVSLEANVRLVLAKVELGEADAAIVYRSDITHTRDIEVIALPELGVHPQYHLGTLSHAPHPAAAEAFVALLRGPEGRALLERHGFQASDA